MRLAKEIEAQNARVPLDGPLQYLQLAMADWSGHPSRREEALTALGEQVNDEECLKDMCLRWKLVWAKNDDDYMEENDIVISSSDNRQNGVFDAEWLIFTKLKELTLNYNRIKKLPAEIFRLSKLDELNVAHNRLQKLPANIVKLACLVHFLFIRQ